MSDLLNSGLWFINWLQSLGSWLTPVMLLFTFLGNEQFYLLIAPAILWCFDSTLGLRLGIFLMINGMVNAAVKVAFHEPRPYWFTTDVKVLGSPENSFGLPSGHAQNSIVVWGTLANYFKRRWVWIVAIMIMFMIGISRIYLAVHSPQDVLIGWLLGVIFLWVFLRLEKPVVKWLIKYSSPVQVLFTFLFSLILILLVGIALLSLTGWSIPVDWVTNAYAAFPQDPEITPTSFHNFISNAGAFFGLAAGWIWISKLGGFSTADPWWKLLLRYLLGLIGVLVLYMGLGAIFPKTESILAYCLRYFRYALIGFWISGFAPWLFRKFQLASKRI